MMSSSILPPGFRFHPTDQELVVHYLKKKVSSPSDPVVSIIADVDLYKFNPWELPGKALFGESEWFFFTPRDRKYPNGARPNRAAASGYWKATGTNKPILTSNGSQCLGVKKALVFYRSRPPKGVKTNWLMHEYRLLDDARYSQRLRGSMRLDDWVLCRVRYKGTGFQQQGDNIESSSGSSSPFPIGEYPNDQEMMRKNNNNKIPIENKNQFQTYPRTSKGREVADEQGHLNFNGGASENSTSDLDSDFQTNTNVSSFKTALDKIRRVLSIGALDELVTLPPNKRLHSSTPNNMETASIFQVSSASTLDSFPPCYSGFII